MPPPSESCHASSAASRESYPPEAKYAAPSGTLTAVTVCVREFVFPQTTVSPTDSSYVAGRNSFSPIPMS